MNAKAAVIVERMASSAAGLQALADLRMAVFRSWPYLYDGDTAYEEEYLRDFLGSDRATLVLARDGEVPIGMATASPLCGQPASLIAPLEAAGIVPASTFYFGESVLLPEYRGAGIGHRFFDEREAAAREAGAVQALFCAVVRGADDPRRPADARELGPFWRSRGYVPLENVVCTMDWKELGGEAETRHTMQFWMRPLA